MLLSPEGLYLQLGHLVADMPTLGGSGPIAPEVNQWIGRAIALVETMGETLDTATIKVAGQNLNNPLLREMNAQIIAAIVHSALARAELAAPAGVKGAFIAAGHSFDAFAAVGKVLSMAHSDILIVDPYADEKVLTDFAVQALEGVIVRLLADEADHKPSLYPAARRWSQQFGQSRLLDVRLAAPRTLHDRLILLDSLTAWAVGQSFNKLAERAHTRPLSGLTQKQRR